MALEANHLEAAQYLKQWVNDDQREADRRAEEDRKAALEAEELAAAAEAYRNRFSGGMASSQSKRSGVWTSSSSMRPSTTGSNKGADASNNTNQVGAWVGGWVNIGGVG